MNAIRNTLLLAVCSFSPAARAAQSAAASTGLDVTALAAAVGGKGERIGDVVKVSLPRTDIPVAVSGRAMPPFLGLTTWAAFTPTADGGAMVMGDLVLMEDEVNPVLSAALAQHLEVTALHNHFFYDHPRVFFMHVGGHGEPLALAHGVRAALDAGLAERRSAASPATGFFGPPLATVDRITPAPIEAALGVKGTAQAGLFKAVIGRSATMGGAPVGAAMGLNTWAAFAGTDDNAIVDGDFAVTEAELQPVLVALRGGGIDIVAIHSHMAGESPRFLFLHYWGRGPAAALAKTVRRALDQTEPAAPKP